MMIRRIIMASPGERAELESAWKDKSVTLLDVQGRALGSYRVSSVRAYAWNSRSGKRIVEGEATLIPLSNDGISTIGRWFPLSRMKPIPNQG